MNAIFAASISAQLATLSRVVVVPTGELKYGIDLSCVTDFDPTLAEVDPASPIAIVQAVIRRFTTPRGALADDQNYGLDIRGHVNRAATPRDLRALSGALQGEAQKDDRVLEALVQLTASLRPPSTLSAQVQLVPADPRLQTFSFTFAATSSEILMGTITSG